MIDASSILKNCVDIVLQSGEIIREHWELPSNVRHKGSIDLVTQTDLAVEAFLKEKLADLVPGLVPPGWSMTVETALERARAVEGPDAVHPVAAWDAELAAWRA